MIGNSGADAPASDRPLSFPAKSDPVYRVGTVEELGCTILWRKSQREEAVFGSHYEFRIMPFKLNLGKTGFESCQLAPVVVQVDCRASRPYERRLELPEIGTGWPVPPEECARRVVSAGPLVSEHFLFDRNGDRCCVLRIVKAGGKMRASWRFSFPLPVGPRDEMEVAEYMALSFA